MIVPSIGLSFLVNKFPKQNILRKWQTYIIINGSCEAICVEFERKTRQHRFSYFQIAYKYQKESMTNPLNIILDDFSI